MKKVGMPEPFNLSRSLPDELYHLTVRVERVRFRDAKCYARVRDGRLTASQIVHRTTNPLGKRKNPKKKGT